MRPPTQAVILVAGASTRTHPLTIHLPKPLLPLLNKPILQHTLEQLDGLVLEAILVVGFEREQIRQAFGSSFRSIRLSYCMQDQQRGTGHALRQAEPWVRNSFFLLNGDDLIHRNDLNRLACHRYAVLGQPVPDPRPFGVLELDPEGFLTRIIEKPKVWSGNPLVNTGAFVLQPEVFAVLDRLQASARGEYEVVDIIQHLPRGERCKAVQTGEYWLPVGYPWKLLETSRFLLERSEGLPSGTRAGVTIKGAVIIGSGTVVEPGCTLGPWTTLGENCRVGVETSLINCLVMDGVQIGSGCHLEETILAHGAAVGDNVQTLTRPEEGPNVHSMINGDPYDTGRATLGAVIGSDAQIAAGCRLYPGVKIWPGVKIAPGRQVRIDQVE